MISYTKKLGTAFATATLIASVFAPIASADTNVTVSDNGHASNNTVNVTNNNTVNVTQSNVMTVGLNINSSANTGGNSANGNTGGNVTISTGNATSNVTVAVEGGSNTADLSNCGCGTTNDTVEIKDNGGKSKNKVTINNKNSKKVTQTSVVTVSAGVNSKAKTGYNKANKNTQGNVNVTTGDSESTVDVLVSAPSNDVSL